MDPLFKTALLRTLGMLLWGSLSAWLFVIVEYTDKNDRKEKYKLMLSLYESMVSKYNMSIEEFNNFSNVAHEVLSEPKRQWTYHVAATFVFQALTTIGYGHITPQTPEGQMLCIFVSLLGIPITLLALNSIGELIAKYVIVIVKKFEINILKTSEPKRLRAKSAVILFSLMVVLIVVNGWLMIYLSDWSLIEGIYFWFITLTTIGFGDYTLAKRQRIMPLASNISRNLEGKDASEKATSMSIYVLLFLLFYIILGLCIVSSAVNSIMAAIQESKCRRRCTGCVSLKSQDEAVSEQNSSPEQRDTDMAHLSMENLGCQKKEIVTPL